MTEDTQKEPENTFIARQRRAFLQTSERFPLSVIFVIYLTIYFLFNPSIVINIGWGNIIDYFVLNNLNQEKNIVIALSGFLWFTVWAVTAESFYWRCIKHYAIAVPPYILFCWQIWVGSDSAIPSWHSFFWTIVVTFCFSYWLSGRENKITDKPGNDQPLCKFGTWLVKIIIKLEVFFMVLLGFIFIWVSLHTSHRYFLLVAFPITYVYCFFLPIRLLATIPKRPLPRPTG